MHFEWLGPFTQIETLAVEPQIREIARLRKLHGHGRRHKRRVYLALPDTTALKHGQVCVIDESGEDYLYPKSLFLPITVPASLRKAILQAA